MEGRLAINIPNSLTILRILLIPVFVGFLLYEQYNYGLAVLLLAGLTDGLDGTIARVANQRTKLGAFLDPLADKLFLSTGFITMAILQMIPAWVAIVVVSRDLFLMVGTLLAHLTETKIEISPTWVGKGTTVLQLVYILLVVLLASRRVEPTLLIPLQFAMVGFTLVSGFHYLIRGYVKLGVRQA